MIFSMMVAVPSGNQLHDVNCIERVYAATFSSRERCEKCHLHEAKPKIISNFPAKSYVSALSTFKLITSAKKCSQICLL